MTKNQAAARFMLGVMVFIAIIAWCVWYVPAPFRWIVVVYGFVVCPTILVVVHVVQSFRARPEEPELYEPPAAKLHNNRNFQLRVEHSATERGGRKFA